MKARHDTETKQAGIAFQAACFLITCCALMALFYPRYKSFKAYDPPPIFSPWSSQEMTSASATVVKTGLYITSFNEFDARKDSFVVSGILWFDGEAELMRSSVWRKFHVLNGELLEMSEPHFVPRGKNTLAYFDIRFHFRASLDFRSFPLDDHHIVFELTNYDLPVTTIFSSTRQNITFSQDFYLPGWFITSHDVETGYTTIALADRDEATLTHPRIVFSFDCKRVDPCEIVTMLLSLLLIVLIVACTLSSTEYSLTLIAASIIALMGYRFVLESISPPHIKYFMIADYLFIATLVSIIVGLFCTLVTRQKNLGASFRYASIIIIYSIFVAGCCGAILLS